jgi:hypothetical protein
VNPDDGKTCRLPEIAILTSRIDLTATNSKRHSLVSGIAASSGGIPTANSGYSSGSSLDGGLFALTYDFTDPASSLNLSFVLEHSDGSLDTGFTMFDFDNDGIKEICYRDMKTLRIVKPLIPYIRLNSTIDSLILYTFPCLSGTGFEDPVIADIDNDGSADLIVTGGPVETSRYGFVYAVGNGAGSDKFAPALPVGRGGLHPSRRTDNGEY